MTKFQLPTALMGIAQDMIVKGWQPVWCPARASGSFSPLPGCTGGVEYPAVLPQPSGPHKLAFRPPLNVVMLDVDDYDDKHGMDTIDQAEGWLGRLPDTYRVTSRGYDNPSGRYMYRIPADLTVTDSSLYQFAGPDTGRTDVEIVRTGHRFSWAPGDYHYKNDEVIVCYDPDGDSMDEMPAVDDLPELPEKWVTYLRNPPVPQQREAYTRPSDGAEWWLSQADGSLGTDAELSSFAYNMLLSRVPEDEIWEQWQRVAVALNPAEPWEHRDFERHLGSRAQNKAADILAHQDSETDWFKGTGADLERIYQQAKEGYDNKQSLRAVVEPEIPFDREVLQQIAAPAAIFFDEDDEEEDGYFKPAGPKTTEQIIRSLPEYDRLLWQEVARTQAKTDAAKILAGEFKGYEAIGGLPDPPDPSLLKVEGKNHISGSVVADRSITVLSGHRAAGKTWVSALWAAQVIRAGGHVIWTDFERQPHGLAAKLRVLEVPQHLTDGYLHYTSKLPPAERLAADIGQYAFGGKPVLFVVDAFRGLQNTIAPGSSANDGDAVEQVYLSYLNPACAAGATVVLLDHMSKTGDAGTFGSERKESAADYVVKVEQTVPFTKTQPGFSSLTCTKDRYGVTAHGTAIGYLWMPGDGSKSGPSIDQYPHKVTLRNWSPQESEEAAAVELSAKGQREVAVTEVVLNNQLRFGPRELGRHVFDVYPELFATPKAATDFAGRMAREGKLLKEEGKDGKYEVPPHVFTMPGRDVFGNRKAGVNLDPSSLIGDGE